FAGTAPCRGVVSQTFGRNSHAAFFFGTLAPFFRASESPMAMACFRLLTRPPLPPLPERSVPRFFRRIALATVLPAALPYLRYSNFSSLALDFYCSFVA